MSIGEISERVGFSDSANLFELRLRAREWKPGPDNTEKKWSNTIKRPKLKSDEYNEPLRRLQIK